MGKKEAKGDKKARRRKIDTFSIYIYKVLKQVHPDIGISKKAWPLRAPSSSVSTRGEPCPPESPEGCQASPSTSNNGLNLSVSFSIWVEVHKWACSNR